MSAVTVRKRGQFDPRIGLVELSAAGSATVPEWILILPHGRVKSIKGDFMADAQARQEIIQHHSARGLDVVFDYEHQTLSGDEAPAAGWIKELQDRGDHGLWGRVEWTDRAKEYLTRREYRYHSPVVLVRKSDSRAIYLQSVALTNTPAIDGLAPLVASATFAQMFEAFMEEDSHMDLEKLRSLLKLPADATEAQVMEAIQNLMTRVQSGEVALSANKALLQALELPDGSTSEQARGKILSLKNPAGYVSLADHQAVRTALAEAQQQLTKRDADGLVELALSQGKISAAQKGWAEQYALKDPAGFKAFVDASPVVVPVDQRQAGSGSAAKGTDGKPDELQLQVNSQLGISTEEFKKYGGAQ